MAFACLTISDFSMDSMAFKDQQFMIRDPSILDIRKTSKNNKQQDQTSLAARVSPRPCMISPWPTRAIRIWREESANTPGMSTSRRKLTRPGDEKPLFVDDHCRSVVGYSDMICKNCKHRWLVQLKNTLMTLVGIQIGDDLRCSHQVTQVQGLSLHGWDQFRCHDQVERLLRMPPGSFFGIPGEAGQEPEYPPLEQDEPKVGVAGEFKHRHMGVS